MTHRRHNEIKTAALLGLLSVLVVVVGVVVGGRRGLVVALLVAVSGAMGGYYCGDRLALRAMRARPVSEVEAPALYRIVRELAAVAHQPMPRLYISPTDAPNAFATGRNPRNSAVCCTRGILLILSERELRGVIAHELAHIRNRDILLCSVAGAVASMAMLLVNLAWLLPIGRSDDDDGPGFMGLLLALLIGPMAAALIRMAISRSREHAADLASVRLTGDPMGLASALRKLDVGTRMLPLVPEPEVVVTSHLMIANPFRGDGVTRLFHTHPPITERIARLESLAGR